MGDLVLGVTEAHPNTSIDVEQARARRNTRRS
jgi:hypothetical protein